MAYDYDVIVIGGGPAGLNAAIRTRWVKRYKVIPCSTLLIEPSALGGMAGWRECTFTGPSWKIKGKEIVQRLLKDMNHLEVNVHQEKVNRVNLQGEIKEVFTSDGRVFRSLAVILALGIKVLVNEKEYLGRGLEVTNMGYEFIVSHLTKLLSKRWEPRLVIAGSPKLRNLIPLIKELNTGRSKLLFVIEGEDEGKKDGEILRGRIERYWGKNRLQGITVRTSGKSRKIACSKVLLDFNSYELSPAWRFDSGLEGLGSPMIHVDPDMRTSLPGVFAAGDMTSGGYNSFSRAISQGMAAGLSAYRYIFYKKFGAYPPLFAYRPTDFILSSGFQELPFLNGTLIPKSLVSKNKIRAALDKKWKWLADFLGGDFSILELSDKKEADLEDLKRALTGLVEKKMITFHINER